MRLRHRVGIPDNSHDLDEEGYEDYQPFSNIANAWHPLGKRVVNFRLLLMAVVSLLLSFLTISTSTTGLFLRRSTKYILLYNSFWDWPDYRLGSLGKDPFQHCRISDCHTFINSHRDLSRFDAVVFHGVNFVLDGHTDRNISSWRKPHQRFVYFMLESPVYDQIRYSGKNYENFWNYTMTYRWDSDVVIPYGYVLPKSHHNAVHEWSIPIVDLRRRDNSGWPVTYNETLFFQHTLPHKDTEFLNLAKRPQKVAWVASHCETPSLREEIVQDLSRYIKVDTFGRCGTAACNVEGAQVAAGNCSSTIARDYKFYLSFENALCNDYVTEKLFHRLNSNLLPIVLGQVNYSRVAPPHSYVNALDFDSPRSLAKYLNQLDQNDSEYLSYFWWKDHYRVETDGMIQRSFCDLCAKLHEDVKSKSYSNFESWWRQAPEPQRDFSKVLKFLSKTQSEDQRQSMPRLRMSFAE